MLLRARCNSAQKNATLRNFHVPNSDANSYHGDPFTQVPLRKKSMGQML
jgi:hypothetical protein